MSTTPFAVRPEDINRSKYAYFKKMIQLLEAARVTVDKGTQGTNANTEEEEKNGRVNEDRNRKGEDGKEGGGGGRRRPN